MKYHLSRFTPRPRGRNSNQDRRDDTSAIALFIKDLGTIFEGPLVVLLARPLLYDCTRISRGYLSLRPARGH